MKVQSGFLDLILIATFSFTHGILTTGYFIIIIKNLNHNYKEASSFLTYSLMNLFGFLGIAAFTLIKNYL